MSFRPAALVVAVASLALSACGAKAPAGDPGAAAPTAAGDAAGAVPTAVVADTATAAPPTAAPAAAPLAGADFIAQAAALSGQSVTLERCSLQTTPGSDGSYACRVIDDGGNDLKTADGLPVDVFFDASGLDQAAKDFIAASCPEAFCTVQLSGLLKVSEATFFLKMTDVSLTPAP